MHKRNCFVCDKKLESAGPTDKFQSPVSGGTHWNTPGCYGSAVFDGGWFTGASLELYICDDCLKERHRKVYFVKRTDKTTYKVGKFKPHA